MHLADGHALVWEFTHTLIGIEIAKPSSAALLIEVE